MSLDPNVLRALVAAGATAEMLIAAVEADAAAEEARKAAKRANNAERQRRFKERKKAEQMTNGNADNALPGVTNATNEAGSSSPLDGPLSLPQTPTQSPLNPPASSEIGAAGEQEPGVDGGEPIGGDEPTATVIDLNQHLAETPKRGTRLPEDWQPTQKLIETARQEGLTDAQIERELARFRDYWLAATGRNATKRDWDATFRNWVREAADRQRRSRGSSTGGHGPSSGGRFGAMQRALARVAHSDPFSE